MHFMVWGVGVRRASKLGVEGLESMETWGTWMPRNMLSSSPCSCHLGERPAFSVSGLGFRGLGQEFRGKVEGWEFRV